VWVLRQFAAWRDRVLWLLAGAIVIVAANAFITLRWGSYRERRK
jgi:hypothetical protein